MNRTLVSTLAMAVAVALPGPGARGAAVSAAMVAPTGQDPASVAVLATADTWVQVRNSAGAVVFSQLLHAGQTWRVPAGEHLSLTTGNAGGTKLVRNGVASPPLGATGAVLHNVPLGAAASTPVPLQTAELLPHPKPAQAVPRPTQVAAAPSRPAAEAAPATGVARPVDAGVGGGKRVHPPAPASIMLVANSKIAHVEPASPTRLATVAPAGQDPASLAVLATADTWVRVQNSTGAVVFSQVLHAGQTWRCRQAST